MRLSTESFRTSTKQLFPLRFITKKIKADGVEPGNAYSNRQIRIAVTAFFYFQGFCFTSWASRIPDIKNYLHLTDAGLGTILFALPAGQLTAMPFSGKLVTHFGSKKILRVCLAFYAICLTNIGLASQPLHLALALYLFGVCGNMCNISVNTQAIRAEKLYTKPIMTSFHAGWSIGGFSGALLGMLMISLNISPYLHFWIIAAMILIHILFSQKFLQPGKSALKQEKKPFFSKPNSLLVQLGIIGFCSMAAEGAMTDWSGVYFKQVIHAPESLIILGYVSYMAMMTGGRLVGDRLISHFGRKRMLQYSGILITTGLLISVLFPQIVFATIGFVIVGLGVSSIVPMVYSTAGKIPNIPPGIALAGVSSISFLGFLMGPPLIGYIADLSGSLRYSFAVIALLGIGIALLVSKLKAIN